MVERFVRARGDLPRIERDMMRGWVNVIEGLFEVEHLDGEALVTLNLIDELTYRIHSNLGVGTFETMPPGSFLMVRLVPVLDEWLISGSVATFPAEFAEQLLPIAVGRALENPKAVFRNPRLLERGWEQQRRTEPPSSSSSALMKPSRSRLSGAVPRCGRMLRITSSPKVLAEPDFSWARDGEALLRSAKPERFEPPPIAAK